MEALSEILNNNFKVLEIGAGPGTLTIPLAKKIVAVESSEMAVDYLTRNIKESRIGNVEIVNKNRLVNYFGCVELASSPLSQDRQ